MGGGGTCSQHGGKSSSAVRVGPILAASSAIASQIICRCPAAQPTPQHLKIISRALAETLENALLYAFTLLMDECPPDDSRAGVEETFLHLMCWPLPFLFKLWLFTDRRTAWISELLQRNPETVPDI